MKSKTKTAQAKKARPHLGDPKVTKPPDPKKAIWCPYCDWHHGDSMRGRHRLGNHFADAHYDEVAFPIGQEPPDLEE